MLTLLCRIWQQEGCVLFAGKAALLGLLQMHDRNPKKNLLDAANGFFLSNKPIRTICVKTSDLTLPLLTGRGFI